LLPRKITVGKAENPGLAAIQAILGGSLLTHSRREGNASLPPAHQSDGGEAELDTTFKSALFDGNQSNFLFVSLKLPIECRSGLHAMTMARP